MRFGHWRRRKCGVDIAERSGNWADGGLGVQSPKLCLESTPGCAHSLLQKNTNGTQGSQIPSYEGIQLKHI